MDTFSKIILALLGFFLVLFFIFFFISLENNSLNGLANLGYLKDNSSFDKKIEESCNHLKDDSEKTFCLLELKECDDDDCFFDKAVISGSERNCFEIRDRNLVGACSQIIKRNSLILKVHETGNLTYCNDFKDGVWVQYCRDNYYLGKAINEGNSSYCTFIVEEGMKNECN